MRTVLSISDSVENSDYDLGRSISTIKDYGLDPLAVMPVIYSADGTSEKNDVTEILDYVFDECDTAAVSIGYLTDPDVIKRLSEKLAAKDHPAVVAAPSIISDKGAILLREDAFYAVCDYLLPRMKFVVLNSFEAELLCEFECPMKSDYLRAAKKIYNVYGCNVFIRGNEKTDYQALYFVGTGSMWIDKPEPAPGFDTNKYSIVTAIACGLANGQPDTLAVRYAVDFCYGRTGEQEEEKKTEKKETEKKETVSVSAPAAAAAPTPSEKKEEAPASTPVPSLSSRFSAPMKRTSVPTMNSFPTFTSSSIIPAAAPRTEKPSGVETRSLVSPGKSIRDLARSFELEHAKKDSAPKEPVAVTSTIEEGAAELKGPKGDVVDITSPAARFANETDSSIKSLQSLKDRLEKLNRIAGSDK